MTLREAVLIVKKRGEAREFLHEPGMICNFVIYCTGCVAHVRIKRVTRVHCSPAWIEQDAVDALAILRAIASRPGISRELWAFLPRGAFRFFRVTGTGLIAFPRRLGDAGKTRANARSPAGHGRPGNHPPGSGTSYGCRRRRNPPRKESGQVRIDPSENTRIG